MTQKPETEWAIHPRREIVNGVEIIIHGISMKRFLRGLEWEAEQARKKERRNKMWAWLKRLVRL